MANELTACGELVERLLRLFKYCQARRIGGGGINEPVLCHTLRSGDAQLNAYSNAQLSSCMLHALDLAESPVCHPQLQ
jgi:hypothetical protein